MTNSKEMSKNGKQNEIWTMAEEASTIPKNHCAKT